MVELSFRINTEEFKKGLNETAEKYSAALKTAENMIASMLKQQISADIAGAGNFGSQYLNSLSVTVSDHTITTKIDAPGADIFESGGTIHGKPLLWLPISGTDAVGIEPKDYGDKLFSVNRHAGGPPLLFAIKDRAPKYFGVPSVNIPKKFHIAEIEKRVMEEFPDILNAQLKGGGNG